MHLPVEQLTTIGQYRVWITPPSPFIEGQPQDLPYYDVLVHRVPSPEWCWFYVDLNKELLELKLSESHPLYAKVFGKKSAEQTLSAEEEEFRAEFQAYQTRKDMYMPLWRLSRRHLELLFDKLQAM